MKNEFKTSTLDGIYPEGSFAKKIIFRFNCYPINRVERVKDGSRWMTHKIKVGIQVSSILLLTRRRTTLVGHLSISVNGLESDFLDASVAKHLRCRCVRALSPSYDN